MFLDAWSSSTVSAKNSTRTRTSLKARGTHSGSQSITANSREQRHASDLTSGPSHVWTTSTTPDELLKNPKNLLRTPVNPFHVTVNILTPNMLFLFELDYEEPFVDSSAPVWSDTSPAAVKLFARSCRRRSFVLFHKHLKVPQCQVLQILTMSSCSWDQSGAQVITSCQILFVYNM